ncbi:ABC transporter substrate-binding protein [Thermoplasma sp.]|uniref:ABC transporter substrate-binding protein n=1 Tax=Thermoplasma sp. TaxID=1973142 RepID=UPI00127253CE|nr:ABC transporter substrate-binding protein [Thermoplasma sp.]KAA8922241.1 MAG: ABC transporter substrate-binding protein [Thermoplasma sp.]
MGRYRRIISLSPAVTEILYMIGESDNIAGTSAFCVHPEDARKKRKVGSYGTVSWDLVSQIDPDAVFTISGYPHAIYEKLSEKYHVVEFDLPSTVAGVLDLVMKVGFEVDEPDASRSLYQKLLRSIPDPVDGEMTSYIELDLGGPVSFGTYSYITDALSLMRIPSIYRKERKEWLQPDFDYVESMDPDIIIFEPKMFRSLSPDDVVRERGWTDLRAYRNGNVYVTPSKYDFFAHHGPSFITDVLPWINKIKENSIRNKKDHIDA